LNSLPMLLNQMHMILLSIFLELMKHKYLRMSKGLLKRMLKAIRSTNNISNQNYICLSCCFRYLISILQKSS